MINKAAIGDVKAIHELLQVYGEKGELLQRPLSQLYDHVRDFFVTTEKKNRAIDRMLRASILLGRSC